MNSLPFFYASNLIKKKCNTWILQLKWKEKSKLLSGNELIQYNIRTAYKCAKLWSHHFPIWPWVARFHLPKLLMKGGEGGGELNFAQTLHLCINCKAYQQILINQTDFLPRLNDVQGSFKGTERDVSHTTISKHSQNLWCSVDPMRDKLWEGTRKLQFVVLKLAFLNFEWKPAFLS